jgi:hypothetical protein
VDVNGCSRALFRVAAEDSDDGQVVPVESLSIGGWRRVVTPAARGGRLEGARGLAGGCCAEWRTVEVVGSLGRRCKGLGCSPPPSRSSGGVRWHHGDVMEFVTRGGGARGATWVA